MYIGDSNSYILLYMYMYVSQDYNYQWGRELNENKIVKYCNL